MVRFPQEGDGYQADVIVEKQHLRLFSEYKIVRPVTAAVYDVNLEREIAQEDAETYEGGMKAAERLAAEYLRRFDAKLPKVEWKVNPQTRRDENMCKRCHGTGRVGGIPIPVRSGRDAVFEISRVPCPECGGYGYNTPAC